MRLPSAYELDNAPAFERFFLVRADASFDVAPIVEAARALATRAPVAAPRAAAAARAFQPGFLGAGEDPMKIRASISLLSLGLSLVAAAPRAHAVEPPGSVRLRRFALLVGVNDGGPARARLRYAASDAHAMARVLESLGGVAPGDLVFVADGSRRALQDGFAAVERMLRAEQSRGVRRELVVLLFGPLRRGGPPARERADLLPGAARVHPPGPRRPAASPSSTPANRAPSPATRGARAGPRSCSTPRSTRTATPS